MFWLQTEIQGTILTLSEANEESYLQIQILNCVAVYLINTLPLRYKTSILILWKDLLTCTGHSLSVFALSFSIRNKFLIW